MANINGTPGNDLIYGTSSGDVIRGFAGADTEYGGSEGGSDPTTGPDLLYGNQGNDELHGQDNDDTVYGGQDEDRVGGGPGVDVVYGNFGNDSVLGGDGSDTLYGGQGNDDLEGEDEGGRGDVIYGNLGEDGLFGQDGHDTLYGGQQNDFLNGGPLNDVVYGNFGNDELVGGAFSPFFAQTDGRGDDTLYGGQGNDLLRAAGYSDDFDPGRGDRDQLFGNLGNDTFDFSDYNAGFEDAPAGTTDANSNRIMDFATGVDKFRAFTNDSTPEYTEVAAPGVTSVAEAINFADVNNLFDSTGAGNIEYVFIAGATHGYLIVNPDGNTSDFDPGTDYAVVIQNGNTLAAFSFGDIINVT